MQQFRFNVQSFDFDVEAERVTPMTVDGKQMTLETIGGIQYFTLTTPFSANGTVEFSGINDLANALNPDFFSDISGNKAQFTGPAGSYRLAYNPENGFMYIDQPGATFPDALWVTGTGMGFAKEPYQTTTSWGFDTPQQCIFCKKVEDGIFQVTFYTDGFNMKFYHINTWDQGEENSSGYTLTPGDLLQSTSDGNWESGAALTPGVYRITINVNAKTTVIEPYNE